MLTIVYLFLKAYEILGNKSKRRSYDSVDPQFDDDVPSNDDESKKNFFTVFGPVFDRNSRYTQKGCIILSADTNVKSNTMFELVFTVKINIKEI
jgi:DnaJ-class molecular chaperone